MVLKLLGISDRFRKPTSFALGLSGRVSVEMYGLLAGSILLVTYGFEPVDNFSIEFFLNGDVGHGRGESGSVPVFFAGRKPDHIAGTDFLYLRAFALSPTAAGGDDQRLAEGVGMPCGACARLEGDARTLHKGGIRAWKRGSIRTVPVNQSEGPLAEGCEPLRLISMSE